jgi:hypothetical protein
VPWGETLHELLILGIGPRPTGSLGDLVAALCAGPWAGCKGTDSEGDWGETTPYDQWEYWYQAARPDCTDRFEAELLARDPDIFSINGTNPAVVTIVAAHFAAHFGGTIAADAGRSAALRAQREAVRAAVRTGAKPASAASGS